MNYIKHLTGFFERIIPDRSLNPTHISLYVALFQSWNINRFQNPISITRDEVMRISKISSKATYHKCMRDLNDKGYVKYEPSFNPYKGSMVSLFDFSNYLKPVQKKAGTSEKNLSKSEQVPDKLQTSGETSTGTSTEQALVSSINNTNISNKTNISKFENWGEQTQNFDNDDLCSKEKKEKEKSGAKKEKDFYVTSSMSSRAFNIKRRTAGGSQVFLNPSIDKVKSHFLEQKFPELEANKFFNYFSSIGWLVGGKTPMVDWKAAAQNWMLNANKFNTVETAPDRAKHLNTETEKDYGEPL